MNQIDDHELARRLRVDIDRMVGDAGLSVPPPAPLGAPTAEQPNRRPQWIAWSAAAAVVVLLVGGLIVLAGRDSDDPLAPAATTTPDLDPTLPAETAPPDATVPATTADVGGAPVEYEAISSVIDDGSGAQLCPMVMESLPPQCGAGIALSGWTWDAIDVEQSQSGITWVDSIYVRGSFGDDGVFSVAETRIPTDEERERLSGFGFTLDFGVPCPEPVGGWPARRQEWPTDEVAAIEGYAGNWINEAEGNVQVVKFTGDLAVAEQAVRQYYDGPLCVAPAQHTEQELLAIQNTLMSMSSVQFTSTAIYVDATGEWIQADVGVPNPDLQASFDAEFGPGVVRLSSPFHEVGAGGTVAAPTTTIASTEPPTATGPIEVEGVYTVFETSDGVEMCLGVVNASLPPSCGVGVTLQGFSWESIAATVHDAQQGNDGYTEGTPYVRGSFDPTTNTLTVEEQRQPTQADSDRLVAAAGLADFTTPCEAPADGWPARRQEWPGEQIAALDGYAGAWSESGGPMTVKFTGDLDVARTQIEQYYTDAICLVQAQRSFQELTEIQESVRTVSDQWMTVEVTVDATGEWVEAVAAVPQPALQSEFDARYGSGTVRVRSMLIPVV